jgi:hypothetical protein
VTGGAGWGRAKGWKTRAKKSWETVGGRRGRVAVCARGGRNGLCGLNGTAMGRGAVGIDLALFDRATDTRLCANAIQLSPAAGP